MVDLSGHVLNRFDFDLMRRMFTLTIPERERSMVSLEQRQ